MGKTPVHKKRLAVAESPLVPSPFLIGVIRPTLLLPQGMVESATEKQLQTVFLHELAHLKRWDVWTGWAATLVLCLHWFNPMLWIAIRRMNADREEACDALAVRTLKQGERTAYAQSLLEITEQFAIPHRFSLCQPAGLVGISETGNFLYRRLHMIQEKRTWKRRWKILALLAVLCIGATTLTDAQERRKAAEIQADIETLQAELREALKNEPRTSESGEAEFIMDTVDFADEPTVEFYPIASENFTFILNTVRGLMPTVRISVAQDGNMLSIVGSKSDHAKVKAMLAKLQQAEKEPEQNVAPEWAGQDNITCVYSLNGINKEKALRLLSSFKGLRMKLDEEKNMLIVLGNAVMHSNVQELLGQVATEVQKDEVGHRPPGGAVGDSRLEADPFDSSAEYRTLPPGSRQPTSQEPFQVTRYIPEQIEETLPSGEKVVKSIMKPVVETVDPTARQLIRIEEEMAKQRDPFFDRDSWQRQPAPPQEEFVFRTYPKGVEFNIAFGATIGSNDKKADGVMNIQNGTNQVFLVVRKSDHEKLEAILAQLKESQESEEKAIADNKPILRRYKYPVGIAISDDALTSLIKALVGKNVAVDIENTGTTAETASIVIWALKSDQDKVSAILEQIAKATAVEQ